MIKHLTRLTRPYQWVKNLFVLLPVFFGGAITDSLSLWHAAIAFMAYSLTASAIYCYNDIVDVEDDRRHAVKCHRPIASGAVSIKAGYLLMALLLLLSAVTISLLGDKWMPLAAVMAVYLVMDIAYCHILKRFAIIDVVILSFGFVLRILAGSVSTGITASHWLVLMTFLLTMLLGFAKRRDDVNRFMKTGMPPRHNTKRYNLTFINQAITVTSSVTVVCYIMYTLSPEVTTRSGCQYLYLTTILVILGLLRYMQLTSVDEKGGDPARLLLSDHFLQAVIALWILSYYVVLYVL